MAADRLDEVLDAAYDCLTRYGARRTTMDDIATTMGVSRSAVHQYVRRKDDAFRLLSARLHSCWCRVRRVRDVRHTRARRGRRRLPRPGRRSFGPLTHLPDGLGLLPGSVCPHYDSEPGRRHSYRSAVATGALPAGWALDDGTGALFTDGRLTETVARVPGASVYRVVGDGAGGADERALPCRVLPRGRGDAGRRR